MPLPDPSVRRVFFLQGDRILTADYRTFVTLDTIRVPGVSEGTCCLIRWGTDGLAFRTAKQIFILRCGAALHPIPPADLMVTEKHEPAKVTVGRSITCTLTVVNNGPGTATGVCLSHTLPEGLQFVSLSAPRAAQTATANGVVSVEIEELKPKAKAVVTLVVTPVGAQKFLCTTVVRGNEADNHPENNILDHEIDNTETPPADGKRAGAGS
jgi:uncharacterized repeat protein (TIGR01451 family)